MSRQTEVPELHIRSLQLPSQLITVFLHAWSLLHSTIHPPLPVGHVIVAARQPLLPQFTIQSASNVVYVKYLNDYLFI